MRADHDVSEGKHPRCSPQAKHLSMEDGSSCEVGSSMPTPSMRMGTSCGSLWTGG